MISLWRDEIDVAAEQIEQYCSNVVADWAASKYI